MNTLVENFEGFDIYFEELPEEQDVYSYLRIELGWTEKEANEYTGEFFCARVSAVKNGIELASDYLGTCIYNNVEDFYTTYKDDYYADMRNTVIVEAKEVIQELLK